MNPPRHVNIAPHVTFGNDLPMVLIAGPCQLESRDHALFMADNLANITAKQNVPFVYKTSFDKANRTRLNAPRGIGLEESLPIFQEIKEQFGCPLLTDVHTAEQCDPVAEVVDILQIPAFLCRQTDLIVAASKTGVTVNVKKGQFLAPWDMVHIVKKIEESGNNNILLTERGTSFGYNALVVDPRSIPIMAQTGYPTVIDATHAVQQPGGGSTGGDRRLAPLIARCAVANGVAAVFIETHDDPDHAPSDGPNMIPVDQMEGLLEVLMRFDDLAKEHPVSIDR